MTIDSPTPSSGWPEAIRKSWESDRDKADRVLALILLCWRFVFPRVGRLIAGVIWASAQLVAGEDAISNAKENPDRQEIVLLRAQFARHQLRNCEPWWLRLEQNAVYGLDDRHADPLALSQRARADGVEHSFRNGVFPFQGLIERVTLPDLDPQSAIPAERARARQDEITKPGQPGERRLTRPE